MLLEAESTQDKDNLAISDKVRLGIPVLQVIGDRDEVWGGDLSPQYYARFPKLARKLIRGAKHTDVFLGASEFYEAVAESKR